MRIGYLDCSGGVSGDMFVGALLSAGWPEERFRRTVSWLDDEITALKIEQREHSSLSGLGILVTSRYDKTGSQAPELTDHNHSHSHAHPQGDSHSQPSEKDNDHSHETVSDHDHSHRGLSDVLACLDQGELAPPVREMAGRVFERLAQAEAAAHGKTLADVHFHEVGAVDAMVDVVSVCQGLFDLGIEKLYLSSIPVGRGSVKASHGNIPLPAPATSYLLKGGQIRWMGPGERTTPTGAALATTLGEWGPPPPMTLSSIGTGAGSRSLPDVPNLLRIFIGETENVSIQGEAGDPVCPADPPGPANYPGQWRSIVELTTQIDDATAESIGLWSSVLMQAGALDVFQSAVTMKKNRLGTKLTVICRPDREKEITACLLETTSTLGVRRSLQWRIELPRREGVVQTTFGQVKVKLSMRGDRWVGKPEYESCREIAEAKGVSYGDVYHSVIVALDECDKNSDWIL